MVAIDVGADVPAVGYPRSRAAIAGWAVAGAALTGVAMVVAVRSGVSLWVVAGGAVLPDLAFLLAIGGRSQPGQLPARAVPAYNALHRPVLPGMLVLAALLGALGSGGVVLGTAWFAHLAFDRACGYGLRTADGWQRG